MYFKELKVLANVAESFCLKETAKEQRDQKLWKMACQNWKQVHFPKSQDLPKEHLKYCWRINRQDRAGKKLTE